MQEIFVYLEDLIMMIGQRSILFVIEDIAWLLILLVIISFECSGLPTFFTGNIKLFNLWRGSSSIFHLLHVHLSSFGESKDPASAHILIVSVMPGRLAEWEGNVNKLKAEIEILLIFSSIAIPIMLTKITRRYDKRSQ